jgi:hypothetical protein
MVSLTAASLGGIDIMNPDQAVTDLSNRMLVAALLNPSHTPAAKEFEKVHRSVVDAEKEYILAAGLLAPELESLFGVRKTVHQVDSRLGHTSHEAPAPLTEDFEGYYKKISALAELARDGGQLDAEQLALVRPNLDQQTRRFLEKAWPQLQRFMFVEKMGRDAVKQVLLYTNPQK